MMIAMLVSDVLGLLLAVFLVGVIVGAAVLPCFRACCPPRRKWEDVPDAPVGRRGPR